MQKIFKLLLSFLLAIPCVFVPQALAQTCSFAPPSNSSTATVTISQTGTYMVWSRILAPDTSNNTLYLQIDGGCAVFVGGGSSIPANTWTWVNYQNGNTGSSVMFSLSAGDHTLVMSGQGGIGLDRVLFNQDQTCMPTGTGDNCSYGPTATIVPTATSVPPAIPTPTAVANPTPTPLIPTPTPALTTILNQGSVIASDTFHRPNQTYWGTATDGHRWGGDANSNTAYTIAFSINNNTGKEAARGGNTYNAILGPVTANAQALVSGSISRYVSSNLGVLLRYTDANNWYSASIDGDWLGRTSINIRKKVAGVNVTLTRVPFSALPGTNYSLRFQIIGTILSAKVWTTGSLEPANWTVTVNDSGLSSGYSGIRVLTQNGTVATFTSFTAVSL